MPIAILYGILILISYYWLDKLRIIRKSSINGSISNHLSVKLYYYKKNFKDRNDGNARIYSAFI
jgi:hypothetical protein